MRRASRSWGWLVERYDADAASGPVASNRSYLRGSIDTNERCATESAPRSLVSSAIFCASITSPATRSLVGNGRSSAVTGNTETAARWRRILAKRLTCKKRPWQRGTFNSRQSRQRSRALVVVRDRLSLVVPLGGDVPIISARGNRSKSFPAPLYLRSIRNFHQTGCTRERAATPAIADPWRNGTHSRSAA
jgi:hypothetical protein